MIETLLHGFDRIAAGVTSFQVAPPSRVTWICPSSVPAQIQRAFTNDGAMVYTTPGCRAEAVGDVAYLPTFAGTSESVRVRSGEILPQLCPPVVVRHTT